MQALSAIRQIKGVKHFMNKQARHQPMQRLATIRKSRGLTQSQLATKIGMKEMTICYYETGVRVPNYATLRKLSKVLDVAIDDIVEA